MIEITEKKYGNESYYEKKILVNGSSVVNDLIRVRAVDKLLSAALFKVSFCCNQDIG